MNNNSTNSFSADEWNIIIDKMILAFELTTRDNGLRFWNEEEMQWIDEGLDLFRKYFMDLWW